MANVDRPNGFRPAKTLLGADWNALVRKYEAADRSADTTNDHGDIGVGDPVKFSSGKIVPANSGDVIVGVVVGTGAAPMFGDAGMFDPTNLMKQHLTHAEDGWVWICPSEGVLFEVQSASDLDYFPGSTADITTDANEAHVDRTTSMSTCEITTSSNNDVMVVEVLSTPDNDSTLANARYLVKFTDPQFPV